MALLLFTSPSKPGGSHFIFGGMSIAFTWECCVFMGCTTNENGERKPDKLSGFRTHPKLMEITTHLGYVVLSANTMLERELLAKWYDQRPVIGSCTFADGEVHNLSIRFEDKTYANTKG